jgi:hypothetical protein
MDETYEEAESVESAMFEERMALTSLKGKAVYYAVEAELAQSPEQVIRLAAIAQIYATLELARVTAAQKPKK